MLVLVVEDEALAAFSLAAELEHAGHVVVGPARSSGEAMALELPNHYLPEVHAQFDLRRLAGAQGVRGKDDLAVDDNSGTATV